MYDKVLYTSNLKSSARQIFRWLPLLNMNSVDAEVTSRKKLPPSILLCNWLGEHKPTADQMCVSVFSGTDVKPGKYQLYLVLRTVHSKQPPFDVHVLENLERHVGLYFAGV